MKFKYHLIRFLLMFAALFIPSAISTAASMSGYSLGGLGTLIVYAPFFYFIHCVRIGKIGPKLSTKHKEGNNIPITPKVLVASASDNVLETEEPIIHEERLKDDIDTCLQKAIADCAQGKISSKELADVCALLRQTNDEEGISVKQLEATQPVGQDRTIEKPIGCIPNSSYVPIPWWRNGYFLARVSLGLIAVVLVFAAVYSVVSGLFDPTAEPVASASSAPPAQGQNGQSALTRAIDESRQREQVDPSSYESLARPYNGAIFYENFAPYDVGACPLIINTRFSPLSNDYYVKLRTLDTKETVVAFYVHSKSTVTIEVPDGSFEIIYASGSEWYGEELLFGPDTKCYSVNQIFDFYDEGKSVPVRGWELNFLNSDETNATGSFRIYRNEEYNGILDVNETSVSIFH